MPRYDQSALDIANAELAHLTDLVPPHLVELFANRLELFAHDPESMLRVELVGVFTEGAPYNVFLIKPSVGYEEFLSTLRVLTNQTDGKVSERIGHDAAPKDGIVAG